MFYVASVITFSLFFELMWKYTLLVHYKLNIFQPPRVNQFDIFTLLFGVYTSFILLDKLSYIFNETLPSGSSQMSDLVLRFFPLFCGLLFYYFRLSSQNGSGSSLLLSVFLLLPQFLKQYNFPDSSLLEKMFGQDVVQRQFVSFK